MKTRARSSDDPADLIDLAALVPLSKASNLLGTKPHKDTLRRWSTTGSFGVRLKTVQVGGQTCTTARWVAEFVAACDRARATSEQPKSRPASRRKRWKRTALVENDRLDTEAVLRRHNLEGAPVNRSEP